MKNGDLPAAPRHSEDTSKHSANIFGEIQTELTNALSRYWETAFRILDGSGVRLLPPSKGYFSIERNFFSALFLYSYHRAGISPPRRALYAAINQCLRGIVTGCDNLLDDEYKKTLETDLPETGVRFRSVLDMLASDRVLFEILIHAYRRKEISEEELLAANRISLNTLIQSGAQEASEEAGVQKRLPPDEILEKIHHFKTGLLFQSPWAIPLVLENLNRNTAEPILKALYDIGMGCQILDDMVDLESDLKNDRHNYILSLIHRDADSGAWDRLNRIRSSSERKDSNDLPKAFPDIQRVAAEKALGYLTRGLDVLFAADSPSQTPLAVQFLVRRIGAEYWIFPDPA